MSQPTLDITNISGGHGLACGPAWHPDGYLLFCDKKKDRICFWTSEGTKTYRRSAGSPYLLSICERGNLLVAEASGKRISFSPLYGTRSLWTPRVQLATSLTFLGPDSALATTGPHASPVIVKPLDHRTTLDTGPLETGWACRYLDWLISLEIDNGFQCVRIRDIQNLKLSTHIALKRTDVMCVVQSGPNSMILLTREIIERIDMTGQTVARSALPEVGTGLCSGDNGATYVSCETSIFRVEPSAS